MTGILIRHILTTYAISALGLAFWRALFIAAFLLIGLRIWRPQWLTIERREVGFYLLYGLVGVAMEHTLWITSVSLNGAAVATVLMYVAPVFVVLVSHWLFREPITLYKWLAIVCIVLGTVLVSRLYQTSLWSATRLGLVVGVAAAGTYAAYTLFSKRATQERPPLVAMAYAFAIGSLFMLVIQRGSNVFALGTDWRGWLMVLLLALLPSLGGYAMITASLRDLPAGVTSLILPLEIVFAGVMAYALLGERWEWPQIAGACLIIVGAVMAAWRNMEREGELD